jgi:S-adenosylmethionine:tRNA ribosyltransferase-isomerase
VGRPGITHGVVDGLLTGFHDAGTSHLAMLAAVAGRETVLDAYRAAVAAGYLWHEFGDVHLLWASPRGRSSNRS